jgi:uncharacterized protein (DUF488 family)
VNFLAGYLKGLAIDAFIARLQAAQLKTVVDVRELPPSRKKRFSKTAFCAALSAHGIAYLHAPALGCPKPIRNQYKVDGNWQTYTREFLKYILMWPARRASWAGRRNWCVNNHPVHCRCKFGLTFNHWRGRHANQ